MITHSPGLLFSIISDDPSLQKHRGTYFYLEDFIRETMGQTDCPLKDVGHAFLERFALFLVERFEPDPSLHIRTVRDILGQVPLLSRIPLPDMGNILAQEKAMTVACLSQSELFRMGFKVLGGDLNNVRNIFMMECLSGMDFYSMWHALGRKKVFVLPSPILSTEKSRRLKLVYKLSQIILTHFVDRFQMMGPEEYKVKLGSLGQLCGIEKNLDHSCSRETFRKITMSRHFDVIGFLKDYLTAQNVQKPNTGVQLGLF